MFEDLVIFSEDQSCMFYADKLYWENDKDSSGNYSLDLERSSCTQNTTIIDGQNTTYAMYGFSLPKKNH
jgi:hypothetical protein